MIRSHLIYYVCLNVVFQDTLYSLSLIITDLLDFDSYCLLTYAFNLLEFTWLSDQYLKHYILNLPDCDYNLSLITYNNLPDFQINIA